MSDPSKKSGWVHFCAAFRYSMSGLRMMGQETAFRQELLLGAVQLVLLTVLELPSVVKLVLLALYGLVLITEMLNTAIEAVVDLVSSEYHPLAKRAKDIGSAAVFVALCLLGVGWLVAIG